MSITWNGVSSDTIGVIVERIPNRYVPTRRFSPQQVAGRNGNILLVDKAFPNVEQEYEVYLSAEAQGLPSVARACAEWLMGPDGYCRLTDSYDTTVYREAFLMGGFDIENILNKFGRCTITFSCKPQKYLLTGDTPIEIPAGITTYTGDVVQFDGVTGASITSLSTTITPTQDLHGYSHPWPAGGGKNKYNGENVVFNASPESSTRDGIALAKNLDGSFRIYGTATAEVRLNTNADYQLKAGKSYTISVNGLTNGNIRIVINGNVSGSGLSYTSVYPTSDFSKTYTIVENTGFAYFFLDVQNGATVDNTIHVQIEEGQLTAWTPYSNICPISGRTGAKIVRAGEELANVGTATLGVRLNTEGQVYNDASCFAVLRFEVEVGKTYIKNSPTADAYHRYCTYDANNHFIRKVDNSNTITIESGEKYLRFCGYQSELPFVWCVDEATLQLVPYDWTTPAGTVYGGTLDVVTGVLTVDRAMVTLDGTGIGKESSTWSTWEYVYYKAVTPTGRFVNIFTVPNIISNQTYAVSYNGLRDANKAGLISFTGNGGYLEWTSSAETLAEEQARLSLLPMQVVYELATPLTYQLTPQEIEVLVGENNVWTSSGPVSVTVEAPFVGTVTNPTPFEARPMLEVSGFGEITINGKTIQILESVSDFDIDCESMEAEDNSKIYCIDFPELSGGENEIAGDGSITALTVTPRWWTL